MSTWVTPALITGCIALATQAVFFFNWLYRSKRDADVQRIFIRDIALNHLPHLYQGMKQLAKAQGVELEEPPPVQFIQFNGKSK